MADSTKVLVSGSVQGVGFRQNVKEVADRLNLTGYARNLPEGDVELVLQGDSADIVKALMEIEEGLGVAQVREMLVTKETGHPVYLGFDVRTDYSSVGPDFDSRSE